MNAPVNHHADRQIAAAWKAVKGKDPLHWTDIERLTGCAANFAKRCLRIWETEGKIVLLDTPGTKRTYTRPGAVSIAIDESADAIENLWRAARGLPAFSHLTLAAHANAGGVEVSEKEAADYCRQLLNFGYLRVIDKAVPGIRLATYRLIRNSGPQAPRPKRVAGLFDSNVGEFWHNCEAIR